MNRIVLYALGAAGVLAACSSGAERGSLAGGETELGGGDGGGGGGNNPDAQAPPATTDPNTGLPPPPVAGPGAPGSVAHRHFVDHVYPKLSACTGCHTAGTAGAPKSMGADAIVTYQQFDTRGYIRPASESLLLTHRHAGSGSEPAPDAVAAIRTWLELEAKERVGEAAPVNILARIGACMDKAKFDAIGFQNLVTTKRANENANNCTGCNAAPCRTCHSGGDANFYMAAGSAIDTQTFPMTRTEKFITKYIGTNGTQPVASNVIVSKATATTTGIAYSHPMYTLPPQMKTALDAFVADAITKYNNDQCGASADAGTD